METLEVKYSLNSEEFIKKFDMGDDLDFFELYGTVEFSSENTISSSFTAECAENAEASEIPNVDWSVLKLCALGDLRGGKSLGF